MLPKKSKNIAVASLLKLEGARVFRSWVSPLLYLCQVRHDHSTDADSELLHNGALHRDKLEL